MCIRDSTILVLLSVADEGGIDLFGTAQKNRSLQVVAAGNLFQCLPDHVGIMFSIDQGNGSLQLPSLFGRADFSKATVEGLNLMIWSASWKGYFRQMVTSSSPISMTL